MRKVLSVLTFLLFAILIFGTAAFAALPVSINIVGQQEVQYGKTILINAVLSPDVDTDPATRIFDNIRWESEDDAILTVTGGLGYEATVKAVGAVGDKAEIKAHLIDSTLPGPPPDQDVIDSIKFVIEIVDIPLLGIKLDTNNYIVDTTGGASFSFSLEAKAIPSDSTVKALWKTDNTDILEVPTAGPYPFPTSDIMKNGKTPAEYGVATITVYSAADPTIFDECKVYVIDSSLASTTGLDFVPVEGTEFADLEAELTGLSKPLSPDVNLLEPYVITVADPDDYSFEADMVSTFMPSIKPDDLSSKSGVIVIKDEVAANIAKDLLKVDSVDVVTLPVFEAGPLHNPGFVAAVSFKVHWTTITTNGNVGYPKDVKLLKVLSENEGEFFEYVDTVAELDDKKFTLIVAEDNTGSPFLLYSVMKSTDCFLDLGTPSYYYLVLGIRDGGSFDLDGVVDGYVWDPMALVAAPITNVGFKDNPLVMNPGGIIDLKEQIVFTPPIEDSSDIKIGSWDISCGAFTATIDATGVLEVTPYPIADNAIISGEVAIPIYNTFPVEYETYVITCELLVAVPATSVTLDSHDETLPVGDTLQLTYEIAPTGADPTVTWYSSDPTVADVDSSGLVEAFAGGTATITIETASGKTDTCNITVVVPVTGITISADVTLDVGENAVLYPTIAPFNATDQTVVWTVDDDTIATVAANGLVTALAHGTATVTATANNGVYAECLVTVNPIHVTGVTLNKSTLTLEVNDSETLVANVAPSGASDKSVTWSSDDDLIATVSNTGLVTAVAVGSTVITVTTTDGSFEASCSVTVDPANIPVTGVNLVPDNHTMFVNETYPLIATVVPDTATNKIVRWSSSNPAIASVSSTGVVTAVSVGTATITVKTDDGGFEAYCVITVNPVIVHVSSVTVDPTDWTLDVGESKQLTKTIDPSNATDQGVQWSTSDSTIATVSATGLVTAVGEGQATITVKTDDGDYTANCAITVRPVVVPVDGVSVSPQSTTLSVGGSTTLAHTVSPSNATNKTVAWTTSNASIATVNNGVVTAHSAGTVRITVTTDDGAFSAYCDIDVKTVEVPVTGITVTPNSWTIEIGHSITVNAEVKPDNATVKTVTWSSSAPAVASVNGGYVIALSEGTTTITAKTVDGNFTGNCIVTVRKPDPVDPKYPTNKDEVSNKTGIDSSNLEQIGNKVYVKKEVAEAIAKALFGSDNANVNVPPVFEGDMLARVIGDDGQIAEMRFSVSGADLLALYADEINLIGLTSGNTGKRFHYTNDLTKFVDKTFTLLFGGSVYEGEIDPSATYELVVFIKDGGEFDLDGMINGEVISSVFFASDTSHKGGSGGGGCNAGYLALAMLGIVPFVLRRK